MYGWDVDVWDAGLWDIELGDILITGLSRHQRLRQKKVPVVSQLPLTLPKSVSPLQNLLEKNKELLIIMKKITDKKLGAQ